MKLLESIFLTKSDDKKEAFVDEVINYTQESKLIADIVEEGIQKGDFVNIKNKIEVLPSSSYTKVEFVFPSPATTVYKILMVMSVLFSILFAYFLFIGVGIGIYATEDKPVSILFIGAAAIFLPFNFLLVYHSIKRISFLNRYESYYELLKHRNITIINDVCELSKMPFKTVIKDLKRAIKQELIPQGHFGTDDFILISSDEVFEDYKNHSALYDNYYRHVYEERIRIRERTEDIQKIIDAGNEFLNKTKNSRGCIKDKEMLRKIVHIEGVISTILYEVDVNTSYTGKLGLFLNYYLPTTEKLLNIYVDVIQKKYQGDNLSKTKKEIEYAIDKLIVAFEGILNQMYAEIEMDVTSEIYAMENMHV